METPEFNSRRDLIASEIQTLLWNHNCVIIPGFGGLIGNYRSSQSHPVSHEFLPPSKQILFNKNLHRDDGLLVRSIAARISVDFDAARKWVEETARALHERLLAGERQNLLNIGDFKMDIERNIVFQPDFRQQYLPQSYGLYSIRATPIQRVQRVMPVPENRPVPVPELRRAKRNIRRKLLRLSPLLLLAVIPFLKNPFSESNQAIQLKLGPFVNTPAQVHVKPKSLEIQPILRKAQLEEQDAFSAASARIFIVAGCYSNGETADGRVEYLQSKGFDASVLDLTPAGLYRVVYGGYEDILQAQSEMNQIREGMREDAWLLIR